MCYEHLFHTPERMWIKFYMRATLYIPSYQFFDMPGKWEENVTLLLLYREWLRTKLTASLIRKHLPLTIEHERTKSYEWRTPLLPVNSYFPSDPLMRRTETSSLYPPRVLPPSPLPLIPQPFLPRDTKNRRWEITRNRSVRQRRKRNRFRRQDSISIPFPCRLQQYTLPL